MHVRTLLRNLLTRHLTRRTPPRRAGAPRRIRPALECLEVRLVPAVSAGVGGGILQINGDGNNDVAVVKSDATSTTVLDHGTVVGTFANSGAGSFSRASVNLGFGCNTLNVQSLAAGKNLNV